MHGNISSKKICSGKFLPTAGLAVFLAAAFIILWISAAQRRNAPLQPVVYESSPVSAGGVPLLLEYTSGNMGLMESGDISSSSVRIYENGLCELTVELAIWHDNAQLERALKEIEEQAHSSFTLSPEELLALTTYLENAGLEMLPPDVGHQGADGYSAYLTVYLDQRKYRSGGYLADEERFNEITSQIWTYVSQEFAGLRTETREKVREAREMNDVN